MVLVILYLIIITGLLSSTGIVGVGTAEPDIGLVLFGLGSADEKILRDIANYKEEVIHYFYNTRLVLHVHTTLLEKYQTLFFCKNLEDFNEARSA